MKTIKVNLKERSYDVLIGSKISGSLGKYIKKIGLGNDAYCVTNSLIKRKYGQVLKNSLSAEGFDLRFKLIADTEKSKSLNTAEKVINDLALYDKKKSPFIIAFGGGVVGDLAGFVASIYKRGIPYIQIPTTLLAQVDSSIGGKTAVDLTAGKNLAGSFYQPRLVISDVILLKSLDARQLRSGLAEVIKYAAIKDPAMFNYLEKNYKKILSRDPSTLEFIVGRCSRIKAGIVAEDEREQKGIRTILNFGHTIGHAIEAASGYRGYNHGEAVALGMAAALDISKETGLLKANTALRIENLIKKSGLPVKIKNLSLARIMRAQYKDKKFKGAKNRFVLLKDIGKVQIKEDLPEGLIIKAARRRLA